ncbi:hypothetical protein A3Q56_02995 [Intoshia linei]|uniref:Uncharacterized protein n=1 Tax=Intoshia linei TaxID=1819745 RepID=A0A177B756_9BILA|nr:hypothetical protein A3Q56_02995 [Intoshia linei]
MVKKSVKPVDSSLNDSCDKPEIFTDDKVKLILFSQVLNSDGLNNQGEWNFIHKCPVDEKLEDSWTFIDHWNENSLQETKQMSEDTCDDKSYIDDTFLIEEKLRNEIYRRNKFSRKSNRKKMNYSSAFDQNLDNFSDSNENSISSIKICKKKNNRFKCLKPEKIVKVTKADKKEETYISKKMIFKSKKIRKNAENVQKLVQVKSKYNKNFKMSDIEGLDIWYLFCPEFFNSKSENSSKCSVANENTQEECSIDLTDRFIYYKREIPYRSNTDSGRNVRVECSENTNNTITPNNETTPKQNQNKLKWVNTWSNEYTKRTFFTPIKNFNGKKDYKHMLNKRGYSGQKHTRTSVKNTN